MTLQDLAKYHTEWIKIAVYCGATPTQAQDIVQNFYIKMHGYQVNEGNLNRFMYKNEPNKGYMFSVIKCQVVDYIRREGRYTPLNAEYTSTPHQEVNLSEHWAKNNLIEAVNNELEKMKLADKHQAYAARLFEIKFLSGKSYNQLSKPHNEGGTGISKKSIYNTVKFVKNEIKKKTANRGTESQKERTSKGKKSSSKSTKRSGKSSN